MIDFNISIVLHDESTLSIGVDVKFRLFLLFVEPVLVFLNKPDVLNTIDCSPSATLSVEAEFDVEIISRLFKFYLICAQLITHIYS